MKVYLLDLIKQSHWEFVISYRVSFQKKKTPLIPVVFDPPTPRFWLRNLQSLSEPASNSRFSGERPELCNGSVDPAQDSIHRQRSSELTHLCPPPPTQKSQDVCIISSDIKLFTFYKEISISTLTMSCLMLNPTSSAWRVPECGYHHYICLLENEAA